MHVPASPAPEPGLAVRGLPISSSSTEYFPVLARAGHSSHGFAVLIPLIHKTSQKDEEIKVYKEDSGAGSLSYKFCANASQGLRPAPFPKAGSTPLRWAAATQFGSELGLVDKILIFLPRFFCLVLT